MHLSSHTCNGAQLTLKRIIPSSSAAIRQIRRVHKWIEEANERVRKQTEKKLWAKWKCIRDMFWCWVHDSADDGSREWKCGVSDMFFCSFDTLSFEFLNVLYPSLMRFSRLLLLFCAQIHWENEPSLYLFILCNIKFIYYFRQISTHPRTPNHRPLKEFTQKQLRRRASSPNPAKTNGKVLWIYFSCYAT